MFGDIYNIHRERLDYAYHEGDTDSSSIVVIGHGVTGNKDRPFLVKLAEGLSQAGIPALRFSFSGNGASEGRFQDSTISKEVDDLGSVLDVLESESIFYAGHSMGGAVGVLRVCRDSRIRYLVSLAGMVHTAEFAKREFGEETPDKGFMWEDENCPLSKAYMDDMNRIESVASLGGQIEIPWLLIHGTEDDVVPFRDSLDIKKHAGENASLIQLPGANHVFEEPHDQKMVDCVVGWIRERSSR